MGDFVDGEPSRAQEQRLPLTGGQPAQLSHRGGGGFPIQDELLWRRLWDE
jgi:hypothetical protein